MTVSVQPIINLFENHVPFEKLVFDAMKAKEDLNSKMVKSMIKSAFMPMLDNLDASKPLNSADLKSMMSLIKPVYQAFPGLNNVEIDEVQEKVFQIFLPFLTRTDDMTNHELMMNFAFDQMVLLALPVFDEFYGEGKIVKDTATIKELVMESLTKLLSHSDGATKIDSLDLAEYIELKQIIFIIKFFHRVAFSDDMIY